MKNFTLVFLALLLGSAFLLPAAEEEAPPYIGNWSNGRGETLKITRRTIQFAENDPVPYRDITRATDGSAFELQITARGEVNAFAGKFLGLACGEDSMEMVGYRSHGDYLEEKNPQERVRWEKDAGEDE